MPQRGGGARVRVVFNDRAWREDLIRMSREGRRVARAARRELERDGVTRHQLMECKAEGPDGTELPGCQKLYVGEPEGHGMVFAPARTADGNLVLVVLAFGERHPRRTGATESVYQEAHRRLRAMRR